MIIMMIMVVGVEFIIMVVGAEIINMNRIVNFNCKSDCELLNLDPVQYMLTDRPFHRTQGLLL